MTQMLIGVDWDSTGYEVCVTDAEGEIKKEFRIEHSAKGLGDFVERLLSDATGEVERIAVGIETPRGALVELLLERQIPVYAINPKQLDRLRDRHSVAGAKDDARDAYVLADSLRNDRHLFHRVEVDHALVIELREVVRADEDLGQEVNRLSNRVREQLHRTHPHLLKLSGSALDPWFWELVEALMVTGSKVGRGAVQKLLRKYRIRRVQADEVLAIVGQPALPVAPGTLKGVRVQLQLLLPRLRLAHAQRTECSKRMKALLTQYTLERPEGKAREHSTAEILCSLPGVGVRVCSALLSEGSHQLKSEHPAALLRSYGGVAPVTRRSGKRILVVRRYACNQRLQQALFHWARTSLQADALARAYYASLRARGHSHGRALRAVADRWLRILDAMLKTGTLYEATRLKQIPQKVVESPASMAA